MRERSIGEWELGLEPVSPISKSADNKRSRLNQIKDFTSPNDELRNSVGERVEGIRFRGRFCG